MNSNTHVSKSELRIGIPIEITNKPGGYIKSAFPLSLGFSSSAAPYLRSIYRSFPHHLISSLNYLYRLHYSGRQYFLWYFDALNRLDHLYHPYPHHPHHPHYLQHFQVLSKPFTNIYNIPSWFRRIYNCLLFFTSPSVICSDFQHSLLVLPLCCTSSSAVSINFSIIYCLLSAPLSSPTTISIISVSSCQLYHLFCHPLISRKLSSFAVLRHHQFTSLASPAAFFQTSANFYVSSLSSVNSPAIFSFTSCHIFCSLLSIYRSVCCFYSIFYQLLYLFLSIVVSFFISILSASSQSQSIISLSCICFLYQIFYHVSPVLWIFLETFRQVVSLFQIFNTPRYTKSSHSPNPRHPQLHPIDPTQSHILTVFPPYKNPKNPHPVHLAPPLPRSR